MRKRGQRRRGQWVQQGRGQRIKITDTVLRTQYVVLKEMFTASPFISCRIARWPFTVWRKWLFKAELEQHTVNMVIANNSIPLWKPQQHIITDNTIFRNINVVSLYRLSQLLKHHQICTKQRGGNITMCAAIGQNGVLHHHATLSPYNTTHIITFLFTLHNMLIPSDPRNEPEQSRLVIIWDNVRFHQAALVRNWFINHPQVILHFWTPSKSFFQHGVESYTL